MALVRGAIACRNLWEIPSLRGGAIEITGDTGDGLVDSDNLIEGAVSESADSDSTVIDTEQRNGCVYNGQFFDPGKTVPLVTCDFCDDSCVCGEGGMLENCTQCDCDFGACEYNGKTIQLNNAFYPEDGCTECICRPVEGSKTALVCLEIADCEPVAGKPEPPVFTQVAMAECPEGTVVKDINESGEKGCATCPLNSTSHEINATECIPKRFVDIVVSDGGPICGLYEDGSIQCWGGTSSVESRFIPGFGNSYTQISAGGAYACALDESHHMTCWGKTGGMSALQDMSQEPAGAFEKVYTDQKYMCALKTDGTARCRGDLITSLGEFFPPPDVPYVALAHGRSHICGLKSDGEVDCYCEGDEPCGLPEGKGFSQIVAADGDTCGLLPDGAGECWETTPVWDNAQNLLRVPDGEMFTQLAASDDVVCGLRPDSTVSCWGESYHGVENAPQDETFKKIAVGDRNGCGLKDDGTVLCWGDDAYGALATPGARPIKKLWGGGRANLCVSYADGAFECWGTITEGEGIFATPEDTSFVEASVSSSMVCGIREDGTLKCWGNASFLGDEWFAPESTFKQVDLSAVRAVCGLRTDGTIACVGQSDFDLESPPSGNDYVSISMGLFHGCALRTNGTVACWGDPRDGTTAPPEDVKFEMIKSGSGYSCGLDMDAALRCWGGEVRDAYPLPEGAVHEIVLMSAPCVLMEDGGFHCWDSRDGGFVDQSVPAPLSQVVNTGDWGLCGVRKYDGIETCWGNMNRNRWE